MAGGFSHQAAPYHTYKTIVGTVSAVLNRYKAVLEFQDSGTKQRALLKVEKIYSKPELNPDGTEYPINCYVNIGTCVKCLCHKFDETGEHKCGWYVAEVLSIGLSLTDPKLLTGLCPLMMNRVGTVSQIDKRQGIISLVDEYDHQHDILFLASKLYFSGKRMNVKQALKSVLCLNDKLYFDAVPVDLEENDNRFSWFATVAWKHKKPDLDYEVPVQDEDPNLSTIKTIIQNPKSQFLRGKGQILRIINYEYGIALGAVNEKGNHWQSILFHRSTASLFKFKLKNADLQQVFKKGDKIRFIAAAAPAGFSQQWVATYVGIDVCGPAKSLADEASFKVADGTLKNHTSIPTPIDQ